MLLTLRLELQSSKDLEQRLESLEGPVLHKPVAVRGHNTQIKQSHERQ